MNDKALLAKLKKNDIYPFLKTYYESIGRVDTPPYRAYTLHELKKCLRLFRIRLVMK